MQGRRGCDTGVWEKLVWAICGYILKNNIGNNWESWYICRIKEEKQLEKLPMCSMTFREDKGNSIQFALEEKQKKGTKEIRL